MIPNFIRHHLWMAATALVLAAPMAGCGSDNPATQISTNPYDSLPNYGQVIEKAQDAAAEAQQKAQETEDALRQAGGTP